MRLERTEHEKTQLTVAVHEAGHIVAQLSQPPTPWIEYASVIDQPSGRLGYVRSDACWQPHMADGTISTQLREAWVALAWKDAIIFLAGPIAELRWRRRSRAGVMFAAYDFAAHCFGQPPPEQSTDLGLTRARLEWAYATGAPEAFRRAWLEAEELVAKNWKAVVSIGRRLDDRGVLTGDELRTLWEQTSTPAVTLR